MSEKNENQFQKSNPEFSGKVIESSETNARLGEVNAGIAGLEEREKILSDAFTNNEIDSGTYEHELTSVGTTRQAYLKEQKGLLRDMDFVYGKKPSLRERIGRLARRH